MTLVDVGASVARVCGRRLLGHRASSRCDELARVHPALDLAVDDRGGREAAGAEAAGGQERHLAVGGRLVRLHAECRLGSPPGSRARR